MASGTTSIADIIVPEVFAGYVQQTTEEKSALIQSGAIVRDTFLDQFLAGGGLTANAPSFRDLDNDADNVSDDATGTSTPNKIGTSKEVVVRLSRNNSWASADLAADLAGADPILAIRNRLGGYWARRAQAAFVATMKGVFLNNDAATDSYHTQYDMTHDIKGASFSEGVTTFSAEAFIDACITMGDSESSLGIVMMHSIVYGKALKNNLIDFVADATNMEAARIPYFLGRRVIVDDTMPNAAGVYDTWLFGAGAVRMGMGAPRVPFEVFRSPTAGNGGGQESIFSRVEWAIHPVGCKYIGTAPDGGPSNAASSNNLAYGASWQRAFGERKQIKIARLITRES